MKKLAYFLLSAALVLSCVPISSAFAYTAPSVIRVGLTYKYKEVSTISITNKSITIGFEHDGAFSPAASLAAASGFSVVCANLYYLKTEKISPDFTTAKNEAVSIINNQGLKAAPCLTGVNSWCVAVGGFQTRAEAVAAQAKLPSATIIEPDKRRTALLDGANIAVLIENADYFPQIQDVAGGTITLGDRRFRGRIEFGRYKGVNLTAVNVLNIDEYLYSVVPSEMPSSWHIEALKAQACAARNYAVCNANKHKADGFDLCDTVDCQVYLGAGNEANSTTAAVNATKNTFILYNDKPIDAVFFSSSGGMTDNSENVWVNALPYFKSVKELNETGAKEWTRTITLKELDNILTAKKIDIGNATGMYIASFNDSGRVGELVIKGTKGTKSLFKEEIRTFFSSLSGGSLESRNFNVYTGALTNTPAQIYITDGSSTVQSPISGINAIDNTLAPTSFGSGSVTVVGSQGTAVYSMTANSVQEFSGPGANIIIVGRGWGHGVGMSQYGAKGMAETGFTFDQILKYYYTGVEVKYIAQ